MSTADPPYHPGAIKRLLTPDTLYLVLAFSVVGGLLFWRAITAYFSSDDYLHIGMLVAGRFPFWPDGNGYGFLRPVVGFSFTIEHFLWGTHPLGYHLSNVALHIANSLLVVSLTRVLLPPSASRRKTSVLAGVFFLTLACHAESVSWISGRTDLLATFFALGALCTGAYGLRHGNEAVLSIALFSFCLALYSKESALAVLPLWVLTGGYFYLAGRIGVRLKTLVSTIGYCTLFLGLYFLCRFLVVGAFIGGYGAQGHLRFHQDLLAQAMSRFAWRIFLPPLPESLMPFFTTYGNRLGDVFCLLFFVLLILWGLIAWKLPNRRTGLFLFLAFWAALLPVINIRVQWINVEGERFMYLASIFAAIGAACFLMGLRPPVLRRGAIVLFVLFQATFLWIATDRWHYACAFSEEVISGIQSTTTEGHVVLVNKPDSYNGALVLRTGLEDGVRYFGTTPREDMEIDVLYASTLFSTTHDFTLTRSIDDSTVMAISVLDRSADMVEEDKLDLIDTLSGDRYSYTFRFKEGLPEADLLYYTFRGITPLSRTADPE